MEESGPWRAEEGSGHLSHSTWVKRWLQRFRGSSFGKQSSGPDPAGQSEQVDCPPRLRNRLLLAAGVLLVLTLMVLLLFWNYQYIIVWKLLHDQEYTSFPVFGAMDEEEEKD